MSVKPFLAVSLALAVAGVAPRAGAGEPLALGKSTPKEVRDDVEDILGSKAYRFCHDEDLVLFPMDREYCELVGSTNDVCPALPQVCKNELTGDMSWVPRGRERQGRAGADYGEDGRRGSGKGSGSGSGSGDSGSGDSSSGKPKPPEPPPPPPPEPITLPGWLAGLARILFYVLAAAGIAAIIYFIAKNFLKGKKEDDEEPPASKRVEEVEEEVKRPAGPVETDVDRLLARARAAAAAGDHKKAIEDAYAALLRRLEGDGLIDMHPSRTNGDYVRSLRERAELRSAVRGIATDVERVQFGTEVPSPTVFESVYRRVLPLVGRTAAILLLVFAFAPLASCEQAPPPRALNAPLFGEKPEGGTSPMGLQGVVELLEKLEDVDVNFARPKDDQPKGDDKVIIVLPGTEIDKATWKKLRAWVRKESGVLVVAGWRSEVADDLDIGWAPSAGPGKVTLDPYEDYGKGRDELALPYVGQLVPGKGLHDFPVGTRKLLLRNGEVYAAAVDHYQTTGGGKIVVFADDRLFANVALALGDNAAYLRTFFGNHRKKTIEIWDDPAGAGGEGSGEGSDSPLESLAKAHLLPVILQLLALVILYLIYRGTRSNTPRDPKEESRRRFADHTRALGMAYARSKATRHATSIFSVWALDRLRERVLGSGRGGLAPLAEAIAARTGRPLGEVMQVLMEASTMRDEVAPPSSFRSPDLSAARGGPPDAKGEGERHLWVMSQLDSYLAATTSKTKTARRAAG